MSRRTKIFRSTYAGAIAGVVLWTGLSVGPNTAGADVFTLVQRARQALSGLDATPHPAGIRRITINDVPISANLFFVKQEPAEAIRRIATDYSDRYLAEINVDDPFAKLDAAIEEVSKPFNDNELVMREVSSMLGIRSEIEQLVDHGVAELVTGIEKPFFSVSDDWAMFGRFPTATWTQNDSGQASGWIRHSYRGLGFVVIATRAPDSKSSILWRLGFPQGFKWSQIAQGGTGDAPGSDINGLLRFPGSRRIGSIGEDAEFGKFEIATFVGDGSVQEHVSYYERLLQSEGYTSMPHTSVRDGSAWITGSKPGSQVSVFITHSADTNRVVDVLQWRSGA